MRTLANYNELWDGKGVRVDRRTSESYHAKGVRLTTAIQVQEPTLSAFLDASGSLARGTGFLARFLIAWPTSTQGSRFYTDPPAHWPQLTIFRQRITNILNSPQPIEDNVLKPALLTLSPPAKAVWTSLHDEIERQLAVDGEFSSVRDVASKNADNAVRLAALFHVMEGAKGQISEQHMRGAARIAKWHLNESLRFLGCIGLSPEQKNAVKLEEWLIAKCKRDKVAEISTQKVAQYAPNALRTKATLDPAVAILIGANRIKLVEEKNRVIRVNPSLLID